MTWMTADEAVALLGTKRQTLYAYVSRGLLRVRPHPEDPRRSLYARADLERLAGRGVGRASRQATAAEAMSWGSPVLRTSVSTIEKGRLLYRGEDAVTLAETQTLEGVAARLWQVPPEAVTKGRRGPMIRRVPKGPLEAALLALARTAAGGLPTFGRARQAMSGEAAAVFHLMADAMVAPAKTRGSPLHLRLAEAWSRPKAADLLRRALMLLADHELNASTFATRVTASTGASLSASVLSGLATLTGPLHGGAAAAARGFLALAAAKGAEAAIAETLAEGRRIPAFGHPLYPGGDVRAMALLAAFPLSAELARLVRAVEETTGEKPNVDFALAALTAHLRLPDDAPFTLFALARTVGWLAHAMEQAESGALIRPRAKYVGAEYVGAE